MKFKFYILSLFSRDYFADRYYKNEKYVVYLEKLKILGSTVKDIVVTIH